MAAYILTSCDIIVTGDEVWGEEEDQMFEQESYNSESTYQTADAGTTFSRQQSEEPVTYPEPEPVAYPEQEWASEEERHKWLKEKEEKSAKFEEIARQRGIQIVDPKDLEENSATEFSKAEESEEIEQGEVVEENIEEQNAENAAGAERTVPASTDEPPIDAVAAAEISPREVAQEVVAEVGCRFHVIICKLR